MEYRIVIRKGKTTETAVVLAKDGIWLHQKNKRSETFTQLSARIPADLKVYREPDPFHDGRYYLRVAFKNSTAIEGEPAELAANLTHISKEYLAQALQILAEKEEAIIKPRVRGFYLFPDGKIRWCDGDQVGVCPDLTTQEGKEEAKQLAQETKESMKHFIVSLMELCKNHPNQKKLITVVASFISLLMTPIRKNLGKETPGLLLYGEPHTGKTTVADFLARGLLGQYLETGGSIHTPARYARLVGSNPILVVDEAEKLFASFAKDSGLVDIFKAIHTTSVKARSVLTKDRQQITEWARAGVIYICNPDTFQIDEAIRRRLIAIYFSEEDKVEKHNITIPDMQKVMKWIAFEIEPRSGKVVEMIRQEKTKADIILLGAQILDWTLPSLAKVIGLGESFVEIVENYIASNPIEIEAENIYHSDHKALAEIMSSIAQIIRRAESVEKAQQEIERMSIAGIMIRNGKVCITKTFVANMKHQIKMTRLAKLLAEEGYHAVYEAIWNGRRTVRAVTIPVNELFFDQAGEKNEIAKPSPDTIQTPPPKYPLPF